MESGLPSTVRPYNSYYQALKTDGSQHAGIFAPSTSTYPPPTPVIHPPPIFPDTQTFSRKDLSSGRVAAEGNAGKHCCLTAQQLTNTVRGQMCTCKIAQTRRGEETCARHDGSLASMHGYKPTAVKRQETVVYPGPSSRSRSSPSCSRLQWPACWWSLTSLFSFS